MQNAASARVFDCASSVAAVYHACGGSAPQSSYEGRLKAAAGKIARRARKAALYAREPERLGATRTSIPNTLFRHAAQNSALFTSSRSTA